MRNEQRLYATLRSNSVFKPALGAALVLAVLVPHAAGARDGPPTPQATPPAALGFSDLVQANRSAVVAVRAMSKLKPLQPQIPGGDRPDVPNGGAPGNGGQRPEAPAQPEYQTELSQASGFFVSEDGYVLTSSQAVHNAAQIEIEMEKGDQHPARLVGSDADSGLALLKVDGRAAFPRLRLSAGTPRAGDWIVAIGNPFGIGMTATAGIVSGEVRREPSQGKLLQLDVPANIGDAGGPAFDSDGNVVGVTVAIVATPGGTSGPLLAVPAATVKEVLGRFKARQ